MNPWLAALASAFFGVSFTFAASDPRCYGAFIASFISLMLAKWLGGGH